MERGVIFVSVRDRKSCLCATFLCTIVQINDFLDSFIFCLMQFKLMSMTDTFLNWDNCWELVTKNPVLPHCTFSDFTVNVYCLCTCTVFTASKRVYCTHGEKDLEL